ncbi:trehalose-phosphatase [Gloeomargarita lithophora Alchichica-D10]|uniref:Trehalose-phosphatase n=1 Tax=Gloeomargarita lithophora Alchichica-D10 TaxID=1188229 RepID=A0A1J0A8W5_9CYAN|nr:trehalose-6-phosphate synthase [Gloeomargarita lithophora]APB32378.1 trehalose-phosphatase [Gloeomargarita lithophora Alchichica-D10]
MTKKTSLDSTVTPVVSATHPGRLVIVSNREPYTIQTHGNEVRIERMPGGLVSALDPVLRLRDGLWICWEDASKKVVEVDDVASDEDNIDWEKIQLPYDIQPVPLTQEEINHYYYGYANTRLWPLFHYFISQCNFFDERDWPSYVTANQKFADTVVNCTDAEDWIWVQDYHLLLVPELVRKQRQNHRISLFLHIPFPALEVFKILPKRDVILRGMLGSDLIGFHIPDYGTYFLDAVERLLPSEEVKVEREHQRIYYQGRVIQVGSFPISIDTKKIETLVSNPSLQKRAQKLRDNYPVKYIGVSVDRLDYTKGILENLEALQLFFEKYPEYIQKFAFIQIASPTRTAVPAYQRMREEVEQTVGRINGLLSRDNWVPIHYFYRRFSLEDVLMYLMIADVAMITPLRDGMNLVAKEYCAAKVDLSGVLVLSELTGAAYELKEALMINPFYIEEMADSLHQALNLSPGVRQQKMQSLRQTVGQYDIHHWVQSFMDAFTDAINHR